MEPPEQADLNPVPPPSPSEMCSSNSVVCAEQTEEEKELATKTLQIQAKRYYLDVKQNKRGRFIKIAEVAADGRNQIFFALSTAQEFRDNLSTFSTYYASLGPAHTESVPISGSLKSETMYKENKRYHLDLKENMRGRFLRVAQTVARGGPRSQIAIPAQGMIEFRDALTDLLEDFGSDENSFKGELPEAKNLRVENKMFFFDIGQNKRGVYMRISEVKGNYRSAITIPEKSWQQFRDIFANFCDKMTEETKKTPVEQMPSTSSAEVQVIAEIPQ
ncbi:hypothetical protein L9F63_010792 [Diploptera punctata]|uniref:Pur-alpha n=1 Tax=Diploptera punctata TaxID=6984 RepID=A0AAD8AGB2_DIPPU|nr:hypothetical protein L9F63_010792 [Diploptera punctata]